MLFVFSRAVFQLVNWAISVSWSFCCTPGTAWMLCLFLLLPYRLPNAFLLWSLLTTLLPWYYAVILISLSIFSPLTISWNACCCCCLLAFSCFSFPGHLTHICLLLSSGGHWFPAVITLMHVSIYYIRWWTYHSFRAPHLVCYHPRIHKP